MGFIFSLKIGFIVNAFTIKVFMTSAAEGIKQPIFIPGNSSYRTGPQSKKAGFLSDFRICDPSVRAKEIEESKRRVQETNTIKGKCILCDEPTAKKCKQCWKVFLCSDYCSHLALGHKENCRVKK